MATAETFIRFITMAVGASHGFEGLGHGYTDADGSILGSDSIDPMDATDGYTGVDATAHHPAMITVDHVAFTGHDASDASVLHDASDGGVQLHDVLVQHNDTDTLSDANTSGDTLHSRLTSASGNSGSNPAFLGGKVHEGRPCHHDGCYCKFCYGDNWGNTYCIHCGHGVVEHW